MHVQIETGLREYSHLGTRGLRGAFYYEHLSTDASFSSVIQGRSTSVHQKKKRKEQIKKEEKEISLKRVEICELFQAHTFYYIINTSLLI